MWDEVFVALLAMLLTGLLSWAFRTLPREGWQMMAAVPRVKDRSGTWSGLNLTYYGLFVSASCVLAVGVFLLLMAAVGCGPRFSMVIVVAVLTLCIPASRVLAGVVEKKKHTLTVGGASFLGLLMAPVLLWLIDAFFPALSNGHFSMLPVLAALSIAYAVGEGVGRLACISFGCCYGKPLSQCHPWLRRLFEGHSFVFAGSTKKIAYEGGLVGEKVVPIQAVTSVVYVATGLVSLLLYLKAWYSVAFGFCAVSTQIWRVLSEMLRADYRGDGTVSSYQKMALAGGLYTAGLLWTLPPSPAVPADLSVGLAALWDPLVPLFLECLGIAVFWFSGRSKVTGSTLSFHVEPQAGHR
jgi:prolipoprotein diacylglyceryltransferase